MDHLIIMLDPHDLLRYSLNIKYFQSVILFLRILKKKSCTLEKKARIDWFVAVQVDERERESHWGQVNSLDLFSAAVTTKEVAIQLLS